MSAADRTPKLELVPIRPDTVWLRIADIRPAPENERLYRPVREDDPEVIALAEIIREHGIKEPLVVSRDHYLSGHRRHAATIMAECCEAPSRYEDISRGCWSKYR